MGGRRKNGNYTLQKNNAIEDLVGKKESGYLIPDPNKTMIKVTNVHSDAHKNSSKKKSWKRSLRNSWRRY
jgi:hypothetical protein